jgi:hypothetical protein
MTLRSIQGENERPKVTRAEEVDVLEYMDSASDGVAACRERGRHLYAPTRGSERVFTDFTDEGYLVSRKPCTSCNLVYRLEYWHAIRRGARTILEFISARPDYKKGPDGEMYTLKPGHGKITPRQARAALVQKEVGNKTPAQLKKEAMAIRSERTAARGK